MGWLSGLFGGSETAGKAIDSATTVLSGIGGWIDDQQFTEQEKAEHLVKAMDYHVKQLQLIANENSLRSVTRRWLAWSVTSFILLWANIAMIFAIRDEKEVVARMLEVVNAFSLGIAFIAIMTLYFGVSMLRK